MQLFCEGPTVLRRSDLDRPGDTWDYRRSDRRLCSCNSDMTMKVDKAHDG
jgi:hypothetical protein